MRLLHVKDKKLKDFIGQSIPQYVILSHCWRPRGDEILYEDVVYSEPKIWKKKKKKAAEKVIKACAVASHLGYEYVWIDTCCIDKRSSSELSEAINSMYLWYRNSDKCIAFLDDIKVLEDIGKSRWFTRGWTLQELIAPDNVRFYNKDWSYIGDRFAMAKTISGITRIDEVVLRHGHNPELENWDDHNYWEDGVHHICNCGINSFDSDRLRGVLETFSVATIMSWAAGRETSREEDIAYCLMGLFDVNMPLLYGEKGKAFLRLQEEIIRRTNDQSILAWCSTKTEGMAWFHGRDLASSPNDFAHIGIKKKWSLEDPIYDDKSRREINMTKEGLEAELLCFPLAPGNQFSEENECYLAVLDCTLGDNPLAKPAIVIEKPPWGAANMFTKNLCFMLLVMTPGDSDSPDNTVSKGVVRIAAYTFDGPDMFKSMEYEKQIFRQEFDLNEGVVRKLTLSRILLRRGTHSRNRFTIPPIRAENIVDCDAGEYSVDYALPEFDQSDNVAAPNNEHYGLALLRKQESPQFYIFWGLKIFVKDEGARYEREDLWCKVIPADDEETTKVFASVKEWCYHQRAESTSMRHDMLDWAITSEKRFWGVSEVDRAVLHIGELRREVVVEIRRSRFLQEAFLNLTVHVKLPPQRSQTV
ncbi:heterokaryon incompatibility protein-domain-containing protein [Xylaria bambusicola]|uniref:heterokaryon incompatibility protein-domain-containing protein n=1 Tax=Xylaria bambusicola TaxID=326684 RepID=UPI00200755DE|nr:heterokaryon incompatibility protein-domain-containing protein [Xylaria bambusicola]KAI0506537.1 heterokaryon incompatibility protein-domain-containing protein [Xylaria bambusicola]